MNYDKNYWDSKWTKSPIIYGGRTLKTKKGTIGVDVRNFIPQCDAILEKIIADHKLKKATANETAWAIQKWVVNFLTYKDDDTTNACPEYWQFPFESIQSGIGDCEDFGILTAGLLVSAGVPSWRVKVSAGYVQEAPTAPQGGHAYCIFLTDRLESDRKMEWVILDGCYFEDSDVPPWKKPLAKDGGYNGCYKDVWFTFNNEFSWAGGPITIFDSRTSKKHIKEDVIHDTDKALQRIVEQVNAKIKKR